MSNQAANEIVVPHAFGRFPLNIGAGTLPLVWGLAHGVSAGVWVQLLGAALWIGGTIARRRSEPSVVAVGWALAAACIALNLWFALVADRMAWTARPDRDSAEYAKAQRVWAVVALVWSVFVLMYRSGL